MIIHSDWHIHSEFSYDSVTTLETIAENAKAQGLSHVGITDHMNYNETRYINDLHASAAGVKAAREKYPSLVLGLELTPITQPEFDYVAGTGTRAGYIPPVQSEPFALALATDKEPLLSLGVRYVVGATHWRADRPCTREEEQELDGCIREWYRQQLWLACDPRVTVLGHPWYHSRGIWYRDFSVIPRSMHRDIAAALKENKKYVECNSHFFYAGSEEFRHQYAEMLREMFEMGIPVVYGSDAHNVYNDMRPQVEKYLVAAGFCDGDIQEINEKDFW